MAMTDEDLYCLYCRFSVIDSEDKLVCHRHYRYVGFADTCEDFEEYPDADEYLRKSENFGSPPEKCLPERYQEAKNQDESMLAYL